MLYQNEESEGLKCKARDKEMGQDFTAWAKK